MAPPSVNTQLSDILAFDLDSFWHFFLPWLTSPSALNIDQ
jgi:hypothetical protein